VRDLSMRCVEKIRYFPGGRLGDHEDMDSVYTMILMLSDPADFDGGVAYVGRGENRKWLRPVARGGHIFAAEETHGVTDVAAGVRDVLAVEFWAHGDSPPEHVRPKPDWLDPDWRDDDGGDPPPGGPGGRGRVEDGGDPPSPPRYGPFRWDTGFAVD